MFPERSVLLRHGDLVGISEWEDLTPGNLVEAYRRGIFPWPGAPDDPVPWTCPRVRAWLEFDALHVPRSLERTRRRCGWICTVDRAFQEVIRACSQQERPGQPGTWIHPPVLEAYSELHGLGVAHSVEVWDGDELVGGLYGVDAGGVFCGESMFHRRDDASKLAVLHVVEHLRSRGAEWFDIQQLTPHMARLGAVEVGRRVFLDRLERDLAVGRKLF